MRVTCILVTREIVTAIRQPVHGTRVHAVIHASSFLTLHVTAISGRAGLARPIQLQLHGYGDALVAHGELVLSGGRRVGVSQNSMKKKKIGKKRRLFRCAPMLTWQKCAFSESLSNANGSHPERGASVFREPQFATYLVRAVNRDVARGAQEGAC